MACQGQVEAPRRRGAARPCRRPRAGRGSTRRPGGDRRELLVERAEGGEVVATEGEPAELDRVDVRPGRVLETSQVAETRPKPPATATPGSARAISSGVRASPVSSTERVGEDDDRARRPPQAGVAGRRMAEALARPDHLGRRAGDRVEVRPARAPVAPPARATAALATITTWVPAGRVRAQAGEHAGEVVGPVLGDELDREPGGGRLVEHGRHGRRGAVADDAAVLDGRRRRGLQPERRPGVLDLPAGGLDLGAQGVGARPVAGGAGRRALARGSEDLVGRVGEVPGHPPSVSGRTASGPVLAPGRGAGAPSRRTRGPSSSSSAGGRDRLIPRRVRKTRACAGDHGAPRAGRHLVESSRIRSPSG